MTTAAEIQAMTTQCTSTDITCLLWASSVANLAPDTWAKDGTESGPLDRYLWQCLNCNRSWWERLTSTGGYSICWVSSSS